MKSFSYSLSQVINTQNLMLNIKLHLPQIIKAIFSVLHFIHGTVLHVFIFSLKHIIVIYFDIHSCDSFNFTTVHFSVLMKHHILFIYSILRKHHSSFNYFFLVQTFSPLLLISSSLYIFYILHKGLCIPLQDFLQDLYLGTELLYRQCMFLTSLFTAKCFTSSTFLFQVLSNYSPKQVH